MPHLLRRRLLHRAALRLGVPASVCCGIITLMATANTPTVDAFAQQVTALASKFRITLVAFVAVDPQTRQQKLYASPGAIEATRELVAEKYRLVGPENVMDDDNATGWPDT